MTQITATLRLCSGWSGQYSLFDFSCKLSPFRAGLLTAMAGASINHNRISLNLSSGLNFAFRDKNYEVFMSDMRL